MERITFGLFYLERYDSYSIFIVREISPFCNILTRKFEASSDTYFYTHFRLIRKLVRPSELNRNLLDSFHDALKYYYKDQDGTMKHRL